MDKHNLMKELACALNEKDCFNGAWLYAEKGEIVSKGVLGFRDPENTLPITEDTIFQLASVSKTFTQILPGAPLSRRNCPASAEPHQRNSRLF